MAQKNVMAWLNKTLLWERTEREGVGERKWNRSSFATIGLQSYRNEIFKKNLNSNLLQLCISQHYAHTHMHSYVCTYRVRNVIHRQHSSRIHTHTHTHRVTNAPTYTNTHTDTFVAVTRATTFVGFLLNNVCGTQIYLNFSRVPHFSSFLMFFYFLSPPCCFILQWMPPPLRLSSVPFTHTHWTEHTLTQTHLKWSPFPAVKRVQLLMLLRKYLTAVMYVLHVIMVII